MTIITSIKKSLEEVNTFLTSDKMKTELRFKDGFFLKVVKHIINNKQELEIHTSGYDGTMEVKEAIEWIKWELLDLNANGIII